MTTLIKNNYINTNIFKSLYNYIQKLQLKKSQFKIPKSNNKIYIIIQ